MIAEFHFPKDQGRGLLISSDIDNAWYDLVREAIRLVEILLVIFAVMGESAAPPNITYTCGAKGVVLQPGGISLDHIAIAISSGSSIEYCKPTDVDLTPCKNSQNNNSLTLFYEDQTITNKIMGGKQTFKYYKLTCSDTGFTATKTSKVFHAKGKETIIKPQIVNIKHDFNLLLKKDKKDVDRTTDITIGNPLVLLMTGTDVVITPENCTAYPEGGDSSTKVTIWTAFVNKGQQHCVNTEPDVIETGKWSMTAVDKPDIEMKLFAFRFEKKPEVVIECTATVCSTKKPNTCTQECVTAATAAPPVGTTSPKTLRKRRGIESGGKDDSQRVRSSSVSFAVREIEAQNNSSPGLTYSF
ncbi:unnamed protein product [Mytilus coruscus]|uniref:ZP domain-containing protein n=1 Tax=Mytilus coruscus TaxID=42192 RepID=A0A6J8AMA9_MYTCO|nr:unnamed protein product [Mytilus coruscus]